MAIFAFCTIPCLGEPPSVCANVGLVEMVSFLIFLEPIMWPWINIYNVNKLPEDTNSSSNSFSSTVLPYLDWIGHLFVISGAIRAALLACIIVYGPSLLTFCSREDYQNYPALGAFNQIEDFDIDGDNTTSIATDGNIDTNIIYSWALPIIVRNVTFTWIICGFWDWFLYYSPFSKRMKPYKMNAIRPPFNQIVHDAFWTTIASVIWSAIEVSYCYVACTYRSLMPNTELFTWSTLFWICLNTHIRMPHFYITHRIMHPWKLDMRLGGFHIPVPDIGQWLYTYVHSLHHKSSNPTTFSGTSMHPLEAFLYYSACIIPIYFKQHPVVVLACLIDCAVGAWLGHDGFQLPYGAGDDFHYLHHKHFDCNYGSAIDSIDLLFGTAIANEDELWTMRERSVRLKTKSVQVDKCHKEF